MKAGAKRLASDEQGRVMMLALVLLVVGGLMLAPLLGLMSTGLTAGQVYENSTDGLYAADAGVEDALWKIEYQVAELPGPGCGGDPPNYWSYNMTDDVNTINGRNVEVTITYVNNQTGSLTYKVTSVATAHNNARTTIESYVQAIVGGEFNIFSGVLSSKGNIDFVSHGSTVTGDIYYVGTLDPDFTHISGNETKVTLADFPTSAQDLAFAQMLEAEAMAGQNYTGDMNINSDTTLGSIYINGNLNIQKEVVVTVTGIVYVTGSITAAKDYTLTGSGSRIALIAQGNIDIRKVSDLGSDAECIIMSVNGDIAIKKEATVTGLVYAPNGQISFDKNATVNGSIIGDSITVKKDASLAYVGKWIGFDLPGQLPGRVIIRTYDINP